jgi:hypothetical protein
LIPDQVDIGGEQFRWKQKNINGVVVKTGGEVRQENRKTFSTYNQKLLGIST